MHSAYASATTAKPYIYYKHIGFERQRERDGGVHQRKLFSQLKASTFFSTKEISYGYEVHVSVCKVVCV